MDVVYNFEIDCRARGYSDRTIESYKGHINYFLENYELDSDLNDFKEFLISLRNERKLSLSTITKYFASLSTFYDYLEYEGIISCNLVPKFRKRYLRNYKRLHTPETRQLLSVDQMADLINSVDDLAYKTMMLFFAKTGIRRDELIRLDKIDISLDTKIVILKPAPKRSNRYVFFDEETRNLLINYLDSRSGDAQALFLGPVSGKRIYRNLVYDVVTRYALQAGYHDPGGRLHQKFTPHCFRHWFTTHLLRSGCSREFVQELRGDSRRETIDIYDHIELDELQAVYEKHIPQLNLD